MRQAGRNAVDSAWMLPGPGLPFFCRRQCLYRQGGLGQVMKGGIPAKAMRAARQR